MPKLGYDMETGRIASWLKQVGDDVRRGEPIAEVETEKATVEFEAMAGGRLVEILAQPGSEIPVGAVIAYLDDGS
jgi:pyruvate dehydrogenase E2 component (dihydrolipoamide acetyltransferase)